MAHSIFHLIAKMDITDMILLTNSDRSFVAIDGYDLNVAEKSRIDTARRLPDEKLSEASLARPSNFSRSERLVRTQGRTES